MAGKTPGTPRKSSSKKTLGKQAQPTTPASQGNAAPESNVTPISVTPISQGNMTENKKYAHLEAGIQEEIRQRAYELYEERGRQHGFHDQDWSRAETEVLSRFHREKSA